MIYTVSFIHISQLHKFSKTKNYLATATILQLIEQIQAEKKI